MALGDSDSRFGGSELSTGVGGGNFGTGPGGIAASNEGSGEDEQRPGASGFNLTTTILGAIPGAMLGGPPYRHK